jgi:hypothetical protein
LCFDWSCFGIANAARSNDDQCDNVEHDGDGHYVDYTSCNDDENNDRRYNVDVDYTSSNNNNNNNACQLDHDNDGGCNNIEFDYGR